MKKTLALLLVAVGLVVAGQSAYAAAVTVDFVAEVTGMGEDPYTYDENGNGIPEAAELQPLSLFLAMAAHPSHNTVHAVWDANLAIFDAGVAAVPAGLKPTYIDPLREVVAGLLCIGDAASLAVITGLNTDYGAYGVNIIANPAYVLTPYLASASDPDSDGLTNLQEWQYYGAPTAEGFAAFLAAETTPVAALSAVAISGPATAIEGMSVTLTAAATGGMPPLTYTWTKGATTVGTGATLTISAAAIADSGDYTVSVTDSAATPVTVTDTATLTVEAVPMPVMGIAGAALLIGLAGALGVRKIRK